MFLKPCFDSKIQIKLSGSKVIQIATNDVNFIVIRKVSQNSQI